MRSRRLTAAVAILLVGFAMAPGARAEQAVLVDFVPRIPPGETATWTFDLVVSMYGLPNVAFENAETFTAGETVTATISPVVEPEGFGTAELMSDAVLTGVVPDDWRSGPAASEFWFAPRVVIRYTAPSLDDLACASRQGETSYGHVGVLADFVGDAGTIARVDPLLNGEGWVGAAVPLQFTCPASDPTQPPSDPTPPATDRASGGAGSGGGTGAPWMILAGLALGAVAVVVVARPATRP